MREYLSVFSLVGLTVGILVFTLVLLFATETLEKRWSFK